MSGSGVAVASHSRAQFTFFAMLVGQFMAMIDVQIISASVEQLKTSLGVTNDEISWVQTAYLMAEILAIPLAAHWIHRWGAERVYAVSCVAFGAASALAAAANDIEFLIAARILQGFVGGAMLPTVFAFAFSAMPPEFRPRNSLLLGLAATLAPTLGPTLGGFIAELAGWRWLFLINIGPALISAFVVTSMSANQARTGAIAGKRVDVLGFALLAILLMAFEYLLEEGPRENWFDSALIKALALAACASLALLVYHVTQTKDPIIEISALADRNFTVGIFMVFVSGVALLGGTFLLPLFLSEVLGYTPLEVGLTIIVSGATMLLTGLGLGRFLHRMDPRLPMFAGFTLAALGFLSGGSASTAWSGNDFAVLQVLRGAGVMIAVTVAQTSMMSTLAPQFIPGASSLVFLIRNMGGAVGLAVVASMLGSRSAGHLEQISTNLGAAGQAVVAGREGYWQHLATTAGLPRAQLDQAYGRLLQQDALILAYQDCFTLLAITSALAAVVSLVMRTHR